jgi:hypothetical protein
VPPPPSFGGNVPQPPIRLPAARSNASHPSGITRAGVTLHGCRYHVAGTA